MIIAGDQDGTDEAGSFVDGAAGPLSYVAGTFVAGIFVAEARFWRHNSLSRELRRAVRLDGPGAVGLAPA
jgi:hypothetical protein